MSVKSVPFSGAFNHGPVGSACDTRCSTALVRCVLSLVRGLEIPRDAWRLHYLDSGCRTQPGATRCWYLIKQQLLLPPVVAVEYGWARLRRCASWERLYFWERITIATAEKSNLSLIDLVDNVISAQATPYCMICNIATESEHVPIKLQDEPSNRKYGGKLNRERFPFLPQCGSFHAHFEHPVRFARRKVKNTTKNG